MKKQDKMIIRCEFCGMPYDIRKYENCPVCKVPDNYLDTDSFGNCYSDADPGL